MLKAKTLDEWDKIKPKIHYAPNVEYLPANLLTEADKVREPEKSPLAVPFSNASDDVYANYGMPFPLYDYQEAWVNAFADCGAAGMYFQVGAGKTLAATVAALYHRLHHPGHTVVLMPPILLRQWDKWLKSIKGINSVLMYRGTPADRAKLDLNADFILMSMDIFKRDFDRIYNFFLDRNATLIIDEAVSVKNPATQNHKCVWAFHNRDRSRLKQAASKPRQDNPARVKADASAIDKLKDILRSRYS